jgi:hypothetical protein
VIGMMREGFPDIQWTLEEMVAEGETVAASFTMRGRHALLRPLVSLVRAGRASNTRETKVSCKLGCERLSQIIFAWIS